MIVRSKRKNHFTVIDNDLINDDRLDWKELGLLVYLLSKPDNWEICPSHLMKQRKTGRDGIYAILKNLCDAGYASRKPNPKGGWDWVITETPNTDFPYRDYPYRDYPTQVNTDCLVNTDSPTTTTAALDGNNEKIEESKKAAAVWDEKMEKCFQWGKNHHYWAGQITSHERFIHLFNLNSPKGIKAQYEAQLEAKQAGQFGNNGSNHYATHQQSYQHLSAVEQVRLANGLPLDEWDETGTG